jgi:hypothetical protein
LIRNARQAAILPKVLLTNRFSLPAGWRTSPGIRLGGASFQKIKQPLRSLAGLAVNLSELCVAQNSLT